ncbi:two-component system, NtrC family, response regulator HydG [Desulfacinum hydrothermale DSM 13146]|uniref:Two-component system, NtrC family, response regulator HydG n=1 Tax=Desulfacinum hydrothermale DSM 13146 TaxID=1121390 RepID=A0A1W1XP93_9BACT|nr:sigma-54 dependent transcriptional regulator [Desulfacinum hydrothermale]SMC25341.1 two-component system, NtrC family, response regulator HydG [Desulfacinum hydrothermale DSM 13146]
MRAARILFVEDDASLRLTQSLYLEQEGFGVVPAAGRREARRMLEDAAFDAVVTDLRLGDGDGLEVLADVREVRPEAETIVITGYGSVESAVEAMKRGAYDYLTKPVDPEDLVRVLRKALERRRLRRQVDHLARRFAEEAGLNRIVAQSPVMRRLMERMEDVAASEAPVLIQGESGTGKELMAKWIHERSRRAAGPFVALNCGAVPENLLETELFGHVRGAFTGAHQNKRGLWEAADGGTLFLDEVGEIPPAFQVKLLRTLQEGTLRRVGSVKEIQVDVRIIAASNQDIEALVREGRFRKDLYYRINVVPIHLPPLRERPEDVEPLADSILERLSRRMGRKAPRLTEAARRRLSHYPWPGNVRELENTLERVLIFTKKDRIDAEDLHLQTSGTAPGCEEDDWNVPLKEVERRHILRVLARCGHNKTRAAAVLGIGTNTLWRKLKKYQRES